MTSLAFAFGCLPLALALGAGANARHSIGTGIIGGMLGETTLAMLYVPLFFYLLQWPTARFIAVALHFAAGKPWRWMFGSLPGVTAPPPGVGFNLAAVYACWVVGVLLLYPLCRWFAGVKARRRDWWLSYL